MKNKTKLSTAILIGSAVIGATNCEAQVENDSLELSNNPNKENQLEPKTFIPKKDSIELEQRLKELSVTEYKGDLRRGAMCYSSEILLNKPYTCPACGKIIEKSSYEIWNLISIKEIVGKIDSLGYDVVLDETEYCKHCNGSEIKEPILIFKIRFSKNSNYHIAKTNWIRNYSCLYEFLKGNDIYEIDYERDVPIHLSIDVIKLMSGLGRDVSTPKHYGFNSLNKEEYIKELKKEGKSEKQIRKILRRDDGE
ncbi:MAG: hypothetical protein H6Q15_1705 [Bacteroidetes bacterium]|nr:hypothetical protein [Bacteroidota bacterium]